MRKTWERVVFVLEGEVMGCIEGSPRPFYARTRSQLKSKSRHNESSGTMGGAIIVHVGQRVKFNAVTEGELW